jgi:hypothetical protein
LQPRRDGGRDRRSITDRAAYLSSRRGYLFAIDGKIDAKLLKPVGDGLLATCPG